MGFFDELKKIDEMLEKANRTIDRPDPEVPAVDESQKCETEYYPAIPAEAAQMKQYLLGLQVACTKVSGEGSIERVKIIGREIMQVLIHRYGDHLNMEAIAALAAALLYTLDETEKRSFKKAMERENPEIIICACCGNEPASRSLYLTLDSGLEAFFCSPGCRLRYYRERISAHTKSIS
jgi:hypothetical protein